MAAAAGASPEMVLENFCNLVIEDFLQKRQMDETLKTFRSEWGRPNEDTVMFSWYDIALKLRLPELLEQNRGDSILSNLVSALITESSVRNRRAPEVTVSGLAMMPKTTTLPQLITPTDVRAPSPLVPSPGRRTEDTNRTKPRDQGAKPLIMKRLTESNHDRYSSKPKQSSAENWIPEDVRMRAIQRNIMLTKETLDGTLKLENSLAREMKRLMVSDLERAKMEEGLDATRKLPCGCCTQEFLYVNLPMKVSRKAILDIRIKWSGQLNSSNVFRSNVFRDLVDEAADTGKKRNNGSSSSSSSSSNHASYDTVPQCYDQVGVCVFCTQFFQEPEEYRPSFAMITFEERKASFFETKRKEREYWDPLKMVETDRERLEAAGVDVESEEL